VKGRVLSLSLSAAYTFKKQRVDKARLLEGLGVEGLDLLSLPTGTRLGLGPEAVIALTGLRNPCAQLNDVGPDLMQRLVHRDDEGQLVRRAGVMAIVLTAGDVRENDPIRVTLPPQPHVAMHRV